MGLQIQIQADVGAVVALVLGTRLGRRCYLARLLKVALPPESATDNRWLYSHWCLVNEQFKPDADKRLNGLDLRAAGRFRRWLWVWFGR